MYRRLLFSALTLAALASLPTAAEAQLAASVGAGVAIPQSDLADTVDDGYTIRAQLGLSALGLFQLHAQGGWSRFGAASESFDDVNIFHAAVGGRIPVLPFVKLGLNAGYFFGDSEDEDLGFFPEISVGLGPLEAVLDYRFGDEGWVGLRGALRF
jgi:hypothetical protein